MQTINIAIECEKEHKEAVYALATSVVKNKHKKSVYSIYIVLNGAKEEEYLDVLKLKGDRIDMAIIKDKSELSGELARIIQLKWNALVMGDLRQMYEFDLEGNAFGAVRNLSEEVYNIPSDVGVYDDTVCLIDLQAVDYCCGYKEISGFYNCCYEELINNQNIVTNKKYIFSLTDNFKLRNSVLILRLDKNNSPDKYFDGALSELWMHYYKLSPLGNQPIRRQSYIETIGDADIEISKSIPILLNAEDEDVPYLVARIMSIAENVSADRYLDIRIVYKQLSKSHKDMLLELSKNDERMNIILYSMQLLLDSNPKGRFELLTSLIFTEYDKAIYICKDRICTGNIAEMYDMDIEGYLLTVYERPLEPQESKGAFYVDIPKLDLEAAVVNVNEWSKRGIGENTSDQMNSRGYSLTDVFGLICRKEINIIPTNDIWCANSNSLEEYIELVDQYISKSMFAELLSKELEEQREREKNNMNNLLERINKLEKDNAKLEEENKSLAKKNKEIKDERDRFLYEINETRKSVTYKIGRLITYLPRKIRGDR